MRVYLAWSRSPPIPPSRTSAAFRRLRSGRLSGGRLGDLRHDRSRRHRARDRSRSHRRRRRRRCGPRGTGPAPAAVSGVEALGARFGAFVQAVGTRYSGRYKPPGASAPLPRVNFWSIWNEPNYGTELAPQAIDHTKIEVSPRLYRGLLDAAWNALQSTGHGQDTILIGETRAPRADARQPPRQLPTAWSRCGSCARCTASIARYRPLQRRGGGRSAAAPPTPPASQQFRAPAPRPVPCHRVRGSSLSPGRLPPNVATPDEPDYADLPSLPNLERTLDTAPAASTARARNFRSTRPSSATRPTRRRRSCTRRARRRRPST